MQYNKFNWPYQAFCGMLLHSKCLCYDAEWWDPCRWQEAVYCDSSQQRRCCQPECKQSESRNGHQEPVPGTRGL